MHPAPGDTHLLVRVHLDAALDALLAAVGPRVAAHPLALALAATELAEAALLALVRREALAAGPCLQEPRPLLHNSGVSLYSVFVPSRVSIVLLQYINRGAKC